MTTGQVIGVVTAGSQKFVIEAVALGNITIVSVTRDGILLYSLHNEVLTDGFCDALDLIRDELRELPAGKVWGLLELVAS